MSDCLLPNIKAIYGSVYDVYHVGGSEEFQTLKQVKSYIKATGLPLKEIAITKTFYYDPELLTED